MKKIIALFIMLISAFSFSSCMTTKESWRALQPVENIEQIYLYYTDVSLPPERVEYYPEPLAIMSATNFNAFIKETEKLTFTATIMFPFPAPAPASGIHAYFVKIEYADDSHDIVSSGIRHAYSSHDDSFSTSNLYTQCDYDTWITIIQTYFQISIKK